MKLTFINRLIDLLLSCFDRGLTDPNADATYHIEIRLKLLNIKCQHVSIRKNDLNQK